MSYKLNQHRRMTKYIQNLNKYFQRDDYIGNDRFYISERQMTYMPFDDKSGGELHMVYEIKDNLTGNFAHFYANNFNYNTVIPTTCNDFMILCSTGQHGCIPSPHYYNLVINKIIPYREGQVVKEFRQEKSIRVPSLLSKEEKYYEQT